MPRNEVCPLVSIHAGFDAREWSGQHVFSLDTDPVTLPEFGDYVFRSTLAFLNAQARHANYALESGIDSNDMVWLRRSTSWTLGSGADNALFGLPTSSTAATLEVDGYYYVRATSDWTRGYQEISDGLNTTVAADLFIGAWTSLSVAVRRLSSSLPDLPPFTDLSEQIAVGIGDIHFELNDQGYVVIVNNEGVGYASITWVDEAFRDRLGFTGEESWVSVGAAYILVADLRCPGTFHPSRPLDSLVPITQNISERVILTDGSMAANWTATHIRWAMTGWIDGPCDEDDLLMHWHRNVLPYLYEGAPVTLYQDVGETRLATWRGEYDETFTAEAVGCPNADPGWRGRLEGHVYSGTETFETIFPRRLRRRSPFALVIQQVRVEGQ